MRSALAQNVGIGTTTPHPRAILHLEDTTRGFLPTRLTQEQRDALTNVPEGLIIYNITSHCLEFWNGTQWISLCSEVPPCPSVPPPIPSSNSPVCLGDTIQLFATSALQGVTYVWTGPNGFLSTEQNPIIPNVTFADSGLYCVRIRDALGCFSPDTCIHVVVVDTLGTWVLRAPFPGSDRHNVAGFRIRDSLYIINGIAAPGCCTATPGSYKYDIGSNSWSTIPDPPGPLVGMRCGFEDTTRDYGYVTGGFTYGPGWQNGTYRYDPATNSWTTVGNYPANCSEIHTHTVVVNDTAYTFGGKCVCVVNNIRAFDFATETWSNVSTINGGNPPVDIKALMFVIKINDTIYYGAGQKWDCHPATYFSEVYMYVPGTGAHAYLGQAPFAGGRAAYFALKGYGYVFAGTTLWRYDPRTNSWTRVCNTPVQDRPTIAFAYKGKAYIIATWDTNGDGIKEFWEWTPP